MKRRNETELHAVIEPQLPLIRLRIPIPDAQARILLQAGDEANLSRTAAGAATEAAMAAQRVAEQKQATATAAQQNYEKHLYRLAAECGAHPGLYRIEKNESGQLSFTLKEKPNENDRKEKPNENDSKGNEESNSVNRSPVADNDSRNTAG